MGSLTKRERALIDAAIAAGKVTKCPTVRPAPYAYCNQRGGLVPVGDRIETFLQRARSNTIKRGRTQQMERRLLMQRLILEGKTAEQVCKLVTIQPDTARRDFDWIRKNTDLSHDASERTFFVGQKRMPGE